MFRPSRLAALFAAVLATLLASVAPAHAVNACLDHGHVDGMWISLSAGNLQLQINDHTSGFGLQDPSNVDLVAKPAAKKVLTNPPTCLSSAGSDVWILPQIEPNLATGLLWLGWNADALNPPANSVVGNQVTLTLTGVVPPAGTQGGVFCGYTTGIGGQTYFTYLNGSSAGSATIVVDEHRHLNWAFNKAGDWFLTFQLAGTPTGGSPQTVTKTYHFVINDTCPL